MTTGTDEMKMKKRNVRPREENKELKEELNKKVIIIY